MDHDDSSFFNPRSDFPVVSGDSGRYWSTDEERRLRTPASIEEVEEERENSSLRRELNHLEASLPEYASENYSKAKNSLNTSEKIYFLRLNEREQWEYLESRGIVKSGPTFGFSDEEKSLAARNKAILLGMTKNEVMGSFGKPLRVEVAGNPSNENERWIYLANGAAKYIYFESGEVQGWE
jgi:hypothetical protein